MSPTDVEFDIQSAEALDVGDIAYVLDPDCKSFHRPKSLVECTVIAIRKTLKKDGTVDERIILHEKNSTKYTPYHASFKRSSYHKTFFTDKDEAINVLGI